MKFLFDFFPVLLFFITFKMHEDPKQGMMVATAVIMVATMIQMSVTWFRSRKIEKMHVITLVLVMVLGGATLILQNELFFKWKPTVVNWLFGLVFLGSQFIGKKPIVRRMMESQIQVPDFVWSRLNLAWSTFFFAMGVINLYVVYSFSTDTWVNFKLYGLIGLTIVFVFAQGFYLVRYIEDEDDKTAEAEEEKTG
ncbi:MAG: septation protein A [Gammaproteobacteria bacterium]|nr:MAG: septation protein A [Gammaproteobacteria bacterium]